MLIEIPVIYLMAITKYHGVTLYQFDIKKEDITFENHTQGLS